MTEQTSKRRFFIAGDVVQNINTGERYTVVSMKTDEPNTDIFYENDMVYSSQGFGTWVVSISFYELEMIEPYGEYMGNTTPVPIKTGQNLAKEWGLDKLDTPTSNDFEIKSRLSRIEESIRELRAYLEDAKILK